MGDLKASKIKGAGKAVVGIVIACVIGIAWKLASHSTTNELSESVKSNPLDGVDLTPKASDILSQDQQKRIAETITKEPAQEKDTILNAASQELVDSGAFDKILDRPQGIAKTPPRSSADSSANLKLNLKESPPTHELNCRFEFAPAGGLAENSISTERFQGDEDTMAVLIKLKLADGWKIPSQSDPWAKTKIKITQTIGMSEIEHSFQPETKPRKFGQIEAFSGEVVWSKVFRFDVNKPFIAFEGTIESALFNDGQAVPYKQSFSKSIPQAIWGKGRAASRAR